LGFVARELDIAATLIDRSIILNPNLAEAWVCGGFLRNWFGEPKVAIERFERAMRLNPLGLHIRGTRVGMAHAHFFLGQDEEAASWAVQALQDSPDFQSALRIGAASNGMAGQLEQAQKMMARLRQLNPALRVSNVKNLLGPYRRAEDFARYEEGLRRAGLPE
jgi:adenylate cyclase